MYIVFGVWSVEHMCIAKLQAATRSAVPAKGTKEEAHVRRQITAHPPLLDSRPFVMYLY
jgi:hypothetical protein